MTAKNILIPLPSYGFDPTEAAIPWTILTENKISVTFATPNGNKAIADRIMLTGKGLGIWKPLLQARQDAVTAYTAMEKDKSFCHPLHYTEAKEVDFDAILLPGGHDKGVKEYIESPIVQKLVAGFFLAQKPVAAICHGVLVVARTKDTSTNKSVIHSYKTTSLLKSQELAAYHMTRLWLNDYYLTYPGIPVEEEVKACLSDSANFIKGPAPLFRDNYKNLQRGFFVRHKNYLSARWPGDAYNFSLEFIRMLRER